MQPQKGAGRSIDPYGHGHRILRSFPIFLVGPLRPLSWEERCSRELFCANEPAPEHDDRQAPGNAYLGGIGSGLVFFRLRRSPGRSLRAVPLEPILGQDAGADRSCDHAARESQKKTPAFRPELLLARRDRSDHICQMLPDAPIHNGVIGAHEFERLALCSRVLVKLDRHRRQWPAFTARRAWLPSAQPRRTCAPHRSRSFPRVPGAALP
jgi:hypothetical protein